LSPQFNKTREVNFSEIFGKHKSVEIFIFLLFVCGKAAKQEEPAIIKEKGSHD
jgi:hypothetical protein